MEGHLGGADHIEAAILVQIGIGAEGLHHGLVVGHGVIGALQHHVTLGKLPLHISHLKAVGGHQIAFLVGTHLAQGAEVVLRVDHNGVVQGLGKVQQRLQHLILHFDEPHRPPGDLLRLRGHNGHRVPGAAQVPVQDQPVIGAGLRPGLAGGGKAALGHILPGQHRRHPGHHFGPAGINRDNIGPGMGGAQQLDPQGIGGNQIPGVHRLAGDQAHGVLFPYAGGNCLHPCSPPFMARYLRMARSCP